MKVLSHLVAATIASAAIAATITFAWADEDVIEIFGCVDWEPIKGLPDCEGIAGYPSDREQGRQVGSLSIRIVKNRMEYPTAVEDRYSFSIPGCYVGDSIHFLGSDYRLSAISSPGEIPQVVVRLVKRSATPNRKEHDSPLIYEIPIDELDGQVATISGIAIHATLSKDDNESVPKPPQVRLRQESPIGTENGKSVRKWSVQNAREGQLVKFGTKYHRLLAIHRPDSEARLHGWCEISQKPCIPTPDDDVCKIVEGVSEIKRKNRR
jgi:hypothetical protein